VTVEHGGTIDLPTSLAESLAEQDSWELVDLKAAAAAKEA